MDASTIIGIGTVRGGTKSLAKLLQEQGLDVTHEGTDSLDWRREFRENRYLGVRRHLESHDGDVANWLVQGAADLLADIQGSVVVSVRREKDDTVESCLATMNERRLRESRSFAGIPFPTYEDMPIREAWEQYWAEYRQRVGSLKASSKSRVHEVKLEQLGTKEAQAGLANFLGVEDWTYVEDCHYNQR